MDEPLTPPPRRLPDWIGPAAGGFCAALVLLFGSWLTFDVLRASLDWSVSHDTPLLLYMGYLMEAHGFIPYRDFFDMNLLGSYLSYQMIGRHFGFDDPGVRQADLVVLCTLMALTALMLWRLGWRVLWAAPLLFALVYMREGISMTLQREFIGLVPVALGTACATALPFLPPLWRAWLAGFAFGAAATVKPHLVIGLPFIVLYLTSEQCGPESTLKERFIAMVLAGVSAGLGMALPLLAFLGYLVYHGVLNDFLNGTFGYLPLYTQLTGDHQILPDDQRGPYLLRKFLNMGGRWQFVLLGYVGLAAGLGNRAHAPAARRVMALLAALAAAYTVYPIFSGQFWYYHYLPMMYFMCVGGALVLGPWDREAPWAQRLVPAFIAGIVLFNLFQPHAAWNSTRGVKWTEPSSWYLTRVFQQPESVFSPLYRHARHRAKGGVVDEIARFLRENVKEGEAVQPLDWAGGGVVHAMLRADVKIATPFIYYFHFFHHPESEYITNLKQKFLADLEEAKPRFIIRGMTNRNFMRGANEVAYRFPAAEQWIDRHYEERLQRRNYIIFERKEEDATEEEAQPNERSGGNATPRSSGARPMDGRQDRALVPRVPEHNGGGTARDPGDDR